jgi:hypothetical protein
VPQYRISWWAAESKSIQLRVSSIAGNVFASSENISVLRRIPLWTSYVQLHSKHFSKLFPMYLNTNLLVQ